MSMPWEKTLIDLEKQKNWDAAILLMESVIQQEPHNLNAYLSILYLLMNLLVEEDYDRTKRDYYVNLLKNYFDASYKTFYHNPEYLYFAGRIAVMSEWFFGIDENDSDMMITKAVELDPNNLVYQWKKWSHLSGKDPTDKNVIKYAQLILNENSPIKEKLMAKGSLGEYIYGMMSYWAQEVLEGKNPYKYENSAK